VTPTPSPAPFLVAGLSRFRGPVSGNAAGEICRTDRLVRGALRPHYVMLEPRSCPPRPLRAGSEPLASRGVLCATAVDAASCKAHASSVMAQDMWATGPDGGAPAPRVFFVFTRGDEVGAIGVKELPGFLAPVENPSDAVYLAEVATLGTIDCAKPSVRAVTGGFEVITTTTYPCGGEVTESRTFVAADGTATIRQEVQTHAASGGECP